MRELGLPMIPILENHLSSDNPRGDYQPYPVPPSYPRPSSLSPKRYSDWLPDLRLAGLAPLFCATLGRDWTMNRHNLIHRRGVAWKLRLSGSGCAMTGLRGSRCSGAVCGSLLGEGSLRIRWILGNLDLEANS